MHARAHELRVGHGLRHEHELKVCTSVKRDLEIDLLRSKRDVEIDLLGANETYSHWHPLGSSLSRECQRRPRKETY